MGTQITGFECSLQSYPGIITNYSW